MKTKSRNELLTVLRRACAYNGKADLNEVKAFVESEGIVDADGNKIDVDAVWSKTTPIKTAQQDEEVPVEVKAHAKTDGGDTSGERVAVKANAAKTPDDRVFSIGNTRRKMAAKAYSRKVEKGLARFDDFDTMEAFNAAYRLKCLDLMPSVAQWYPSEVKEMDLAISGKVMHELVNTLGGALVATDFKRELVYATEPYGIYKYLANVVTMSGGDTVFPRKTSIITMTPTAQTGTLSSADNGYDNIRLVPKQYGVIIKTQRQLFQSAAIDIGDDIASSIVEAYNYRCDQQLLLGDGTATYAGDIGLKNAAAGTVTDVTADTGTTWATLTVGDLLLCVGGVTNVNPARCSWIMSRQAFAQVALRLAMAQGGALASEMLSAQYINGTNMGTLLGYPVYFSPLLDITNPGAASFSGIIFGDIAATAMLGVRPALEITPSEHAGFSANQIWTRGVADIAVTVHGDGRSTGSSGSNGTCVRLKNKA